MLRLVAISALLIAATILESSGDASIRIGLFDRGGWSRVAALAGGAALLFGYGVLLNLTPLPFERVVGLYIATLFVVWQVTSFVTFRTAPHAAILIGGSLIVAGGLLVTFWVPKR